MNALIGRKVDQTQKFLEDGTRIPVTVLDVADNTVVAVKTLEKDKYLAVQLGFGTRKKATKAVLGHAKKANQDKASWLLREIRIDDQNDMTCTPGDIIKAGDTFKAGDIIQVTGFSKGKGFAGGVKRYGFRGGPRTHGQSDRERAPGSIGQTTTPGRVYKGKRMAGRMGSENVTVTNLVVVDVDDSNKKLLVKGLVPGYAGSFVVVTKTGEIAEKKYVSLLTDKKEEPVQEAPVQEETPVENVAADEPVESPKEEVKLEAQEDVQVEETPATTDAPTEEKKAETEGETK